MKRFVGMLLTLLCIATCPSCRALVDISDLNRHDSTTVAREPASKLVVTINPPNVKIPDNSMRGMRLATIVVNRSDGAPFTGKVKLTKNPGGICQLAGMEIQLGRDTTEGEDYTTSVCTVTAIE
jgi:hypothetical protein